MSDFEDREKITELFEKMRTSGLFTEAQIREHELDLEMAELTGSKLLTNTKKENGDLYLQAAKETGYDCYIEQEALDVHGRAVPGYIGFYTKDIFKDHGSFWDKVRQLEGKEPWPRLKETE